MGLDGTNNASEHTIGRSKVRYTSMRGYKSEEGMSNGIALTQRLFDCEDEHDLLPGKRDVCVNRALSTSSEVP